MITTSILGMELVAMVHPDVPNSRVEVFKSAFEGCWESLGWVLADSAAAPKSPPADQPVRNR